MSQKHIQRRRKANVGQLKSLLDELKTLSFADEAELRFILRSCTTAIVSWYLKERDVCNEKGMSLSICVEH